MLSERHDRRMLKLGELLETRKTQLDDHNSGRRRLSSGVRTNTAQVLCIIIISMPLLIKLSYFRLGSRESPSTGDKLSKEVG